MMSRHLLYLPVVEGVKMELVLIGVWRSDKMTRDQIIDHKNEDGASVLHHPPPPSARC